MQVEGQEASETCGREKVRREDVQGNQSGQRDQQGQRRTPGGFQKQVRVAGRDAGSEGKRRAGTRISWDPWVGQLRDLGHRVKCESF